MTFQEWWIKLTGRYEEPAKGEEVALARVIAFAAWNRGHAEASMEAAMLVAAARKEEEEL